MYYYRSYRENGKVRKEYLGRGIAARTAAMIATDALGRRQASKFLITNEKLVCEEAIKLTAELTNAANRVFTFQFIKSK